MVKDRSNIIRTNAQCRHTHTHARVWVLFVSGFFHVCNLQTSTHETAQFYFRFRVCFRFHLLRFSSSVQMYTFWIICPIIKLRPYTDDAFASQKVTTTTLSLFFCEIVSTFSFRAHGEQCEIFICDAGVRHVFLCAVCVALLL